MIIDIKVKFKLLPKLLIRIIRIIRNAAYKMIQGYLLGYLTQLRVSIKHNENCK